MRQLMRIAAFGGVLVLLALAALAAQDRTAAGSPGQMDELLAELRALRKDINDSAQANMRAQLLGMRLQLQEQRVVAAARQLSDVQDKLATTEQALAGLKSVTANAPEALEGPLGGQMQHLEKASQQLRVEESTLLQMVNDGQSQWTRFNALIEELERAVAVKGGR